ncbi:60S ribosomal protein L18a-like protein [Punica granatum]|uniref:60S ribosomal protein L18a-like protein n=1 Tax=Punica granatum TaxID=22663 RepID=A0A6P8CH56_PUNGR|nr:60S ribosomal protein L18a-like protein [Punica granatum]
MSFPKQSAGTDEKVPRTYRGGDFSLLEPATIGVSRGPYDNPLPCFGCGIGWFSFIVGFVFPPFWFYATVLYLGNYYHKHPRERVGLAASAIAAMICLVAVLIPVLVVFCLRATQWH